MLPALLLAPGPSGASRHINAAGSGLTESGICVLLAGAADRGWDITYYPSPQSTVPGVCVEEDSTHTHINPTCTEVIGSVLYVSGRAGSTHYLLQVMDGGIGADRLGVAVGPTASDGTCGAGSIATSPVVSGEYVVAGLPV